MKEELEVYSNGIVHCSVCTNVRGKKKIEMLVNMKNPTGIYSRWKISKDKFRDGSSNPCSCEKKLKMHKHYLMVC